MKKIFFIAVTAIIITASSTCAFACGSHHTARRAASYSVCSVESCVKSVLHSHNGNYYSAHYYGDGHEYHNYCAVNDCSIAGVHSHHGA